MLLNKLFSILKHINIHRKVLTLLRFLTHVYLILSCTRYLVMLVLHILYVRRRHAYNIKHPGSDQLREHPVKNETIYRVLVLLGAQYRDFYCASILGCTFAAFMIILLVYGPKLHDRYRKISYFSDYHSSEAYQFLKDLNYFETSMKSWLARFQVYLMKSVEMFHEKQVKRAQANKRLVPKELWLAYQERRKLVGSCRLSILHRDTLWREKLRSLRRQVCLSVGLYFYACFMVVAYVTESIHNRMVGNRETSLKERLLWYEQIFASLIGVSACILPMVKMIVNESDLRRLYLDLHARIELFVEALRRTKEIYCHLGEEEGDRLVQRLQQERDQEALEIYIQMRYFCCQQTRLRRLVNVFLSLYCGLSIALIASMLCVLKSIDTEQLYLVVPALGTNLLFMDLNLLYGSLSNAVCLKIASLNWKLLAESVLIKPSASLLEHHQRLINRRFSSNDAGSGGKGLVMKRYYSTSCRCRLDRSLIVHLVDTHTRFLYYRLICDQKIVSVVFTYQILGCISLHYKSLIRFNFGLSSVLMATLLRNWL